VAIDAQDRVVAVGGSTVARFRRNGTLDPSFGDGGSIENVPGYLTAAAIDSQGRIVAVGRSEGSDYFHFLVAGFLPDGAPDPSLGSGSGSVITHRGLAEAVAIDSRNRIVAAGGTLPKNGVVGGFALDRYKPDGGLSRRFGKDGRVATPFRGGVSALARSVAIDSHRRIVAVGGIGSHDFAVARYRPDGTLDHSFSGNGKARGRFAFPRRRHAGLALAGVLDPEDRVIVAGGESHFLLTRLIGNRRHR
jgi:uncharacterized delta-60 repeat protein